MILSQIFQNTPFLLLEERPLEFSCECSWDRVKRSLVLVGVNELRSMLSEQGEALVRCDFCAREYKVDRNQLEKLISGDDTE